MLTRKWLLLAAVLAAAPAARAELKPHGLFTDNVVLQRDREAPVWGTAKPGSEITVELDNGKIFKATTGADGKWIVILPAMKASTKNELTIKGDGGNITLKNVAIGDVWIASGQSNMEWTVRALSKEDQGKKVAEAATNPNLRLLTIGKRTSLKPESDIKGEKWLECKPETAINFSAVAYFFGRDIAKSQNVTVGLISTNWGGTICEAWASQEGLSAVPELKSFVDKVEAMKKVSPEEAKVAYEAAYEKWKVAAEQAKKDGKPVPKEPSKPGQLGPNNPTVLYNGMIAPLLPFAIKGAIWYQGESNAGRAQEYRTLFPAMITDWRKKWGYDLPFFAVQLAPFKGGASGVDYAELRDAQFYATKKLKDVGISIITDAGDENDIHPQRKEPAGARLALSARAIAYGEKIEYSGPQYKEQKIEGDKVILTFTHAAGMMAKGETLNGFTLCGEDKVFHPATAKIVGDTVVLTCDKVTKPTAARFGWVNFAKPELNFFNKEGLPAVPFRTDDFPLTTK